MIEFVLSKVHGKSVAAGSFCNKITLLRDDNSNKNFKELFSWFTNTYGASYDVLTRSLLRSKVHWSYQLETHYGQHSFFFKTDEQVTYFLLVYGEGSTDWDC